MNEAVAENQDSALLRDISPEEVVEILRAVADCGFPEDCPEIGDWKMKVSDVLRAMEGKEFSFPIDTDIGHVTMKIWTMIFGLECRRAGNGVRNVFPHVKIQVGRRLSLRRALALANDTQTLVQHIKDKGLDFLNRKSLSAIAPDCVQKLKSIKGVHFELNSVKDMVLFDTLVSELLTKEVGRDVVFKWSGVDDRKSCSGPVEEEVMTVDLRLLFRGSIDEIVYIGNRVRLPLGTLPRAPLTVKALGDGCEHLVEGAICRRIEALRDQIFTLWECPYGNKSALSAFEKLVQAAMTDL